MCMSLPARHPQTAPQTPTLGAAHRVRVPLLRPWVWRQTVTAHCQGSHHDFWDGQTNVVPMSPTSWCSHPCVNLSPRMWTKPMT